ncbi:Uu.00g064210.m01.CDS01 [Anthostomella pinea]|uniref:Uu.00g064210.m01.CDS01 n=1 Tax=Anthostomella pinea TaxID=933095 RepID=A0AAI8VMY1_9PEZI|nr:Uu.00g064210.m01.CDS01 [Anthostomella pinea]
MPSQRSRLRSMQAPREDDIVVWTTGSPSPEIDGVPSETHSGWERWHRSNERTNIAAPICLQCDPATEALVGLHGEPSDPAMIARERGHDT